ncbi:MAG: cytochrome c oxidase subunit 3 [bacterium]
MKQPGPDFPRGPLSHHSNGHSNGSSNGHGRAEEATKERPAPGAGPFGLGLFLISLAVLFLAGVVLWFVFAARAEAWPPPGVFLPRGLLTSTVLLAITSALLQVSIPLARAGRLLRLRVVLIGAVLSGVTFLGNQIVVWFRFHHPDGLLATGTFGWLFYFLTGLHALHVVGGLVPVFVVAVNAHYERILPHRLDGLRYVTTYWHFLGLVWLVLYGLFLTAGLR